MIFVFVVGVIVGILVDAIVVPRLGRWLFNTVGPGSHPSRKKFKG